MVFVSCWKWDAHSGEVRPTSLEEKRRKQDRKHKSTYLSVAVPVFVSGPNQRSETMDEELLELQRQLEFAQQVKSSIRLSERNVVELVQKLHELRIIDFDLLHTVSGKEYITPVTFSLSIFSSFPLFGFQQRSFFFWFLCILVIQLG